VSATDVDVVGQDRGGGAPDEAEPGGLSGEIRRAVDNIKSGNLGVLPLVLGLIFIVAFFSFKATNFFTAVNFTNILIQMAGTAMLAFGVVFVLLLGEIDLSISYVAGVGAVAVAELQRAGSGHQINGLLAMLAGIAICAVIGLGQGSIVARVGVPSFVVTLAGFLIWQGVILQDLAVPGSIIITDRWVNYTATYGFSRLAGWLIAAGISALYALVVLGGFIRNRRARVSNERLGFVIAKVIGVAIAAFGTVAVCNHAEVQGTPLGLPLAGVLVVIFLVALTFLAKRTTFGRHVYAVGGNAEAARRAGINVPRIRTIVFIISSSMAAVGGIILAANINSVSLQFGGGQLLLDAISAAVIGGVSLFGGRGEVRAGFLGALVLATVSNGLNTAGYKSGIIYIVTGIILLLAVTLDTVARRLQVSAGR
jgi:D-xylose transport system permease protein